VIDVVLVDDQTLVRHGIRSLLALSSDIRVVAEAANGEEAVGIIVATRADVVLLDVRMPKLTGLEVLAALRARNHETRAILLTTFDDDAVALAGIRLGARGFLLKDVSLDQLTDAIHLVAHGETLFSPTITERVMRGLERIGPRFEASSLPEPLTKREVEVLRLMAGGASNREIADALGTAEGTVKNQASSVFAKLGVRDRTRAVLRGIELGVI
jgi:DNA-binding NarL/FixJ family response regulator